MKVKQNRRAAAKRRAAVRGVLPPRSQCENTQSTTRNTAAIAPVLKKLKSTDVNERAWAGSCIANFLLEQEPRETLINAGVILTLIAALADEKKEVGAEVAGALRNIVSLLLDAINTSTPDASTLDLTADRRGLILDQLLDGRVVEALLAEMPVVLTLISGYIQTPPTKDEGKSEYSMSLVFLEQILLVLLCLGQLDEGNQTPSSIIALATEAGLAIQLSNILKLGDSLPEPCLEAAINCLQYYCEDNQAILMCLDEECVKSFAWSQIRKSPPIPSISIPCCALIFNLADLHDQGEKVSSGISEHLLSYIIQNCDKFCVPDVSPSPSSDVIEIDSENGEIGAPDQSKKLFGFPVLELALEVLSNVLSLHESSELPIQDGEMCCDSESESDQMSQDDIMEEEEMDESTEWIHESSVYQSPEIFDQLISSVMRMISFCIHIAANDMKRHIAYLDVQKRLLGCVNNIFLFAPPAVLKHGVLAKSAFSIVTVFQELSLFFCQISSIFFVAENHISDALFETLTDLTQTYATLSQSADRNGIFLSFVDQFPASCIQLFQHLSEATTFDPNVHAPATVIRRHLIRLFGVLGKTQGQVELNLNLAQHILMPVGEAAFNKTLSDTQAGESALLLFGDVLNAIFDIYADKAFDYDTPVYIGLEMNARLTAALPLLRQAIVGYKKKLVAERRFGGMKEEWQGLQDAAVNLKAFVAYKANE